MAYKTLIFGVDDLFDKLQPYDAQAVQLGMLDIVAYAVIENDRIIFVAPDGNAVGGLSNYAKLNWR